MQLRLDRACGKKRAHIPSEHSIRALSVRILVQPRDEEPHVQLAAQLILQCVAELKGRTFLNTPLPLSIRQIGSVRVGKCILDLEYTCAVGQLIVKQISSRIGEST